MKALQKVNILKRSKQSPIKPRIRLVPIVNQWVDPSAKAENSNYICHFSVHYRHQPNNIIATGKAEMFQKVVVHDPDSMLPALPAPPPEKTIIITSFKSAIVNILGLLELLKKADESLEKDNPRRHMKYIYRSPVLVTIPAAILTSLDLMTRRCKNTSMMERIGRRLEAHEIKNGIKNQDFDDVIRRIEGYLQGCGLDATTVEYNPPILEK